MEKIPTLEELNPGKKKEETSLSDLLRAAGANKDQCKVFIDYVTQLKSRNEKEASLAQDIYRVTCNNIIEVNNLRERNCEELWANNGSAYPRHLIKADQDIILLNYNKKEDIVTSRIVKAGEYIDITRPTSIYSVSKERFQKTYTVLDENASKNQFRNLYENAKSAEKFLQKNEKKLNINKENDKTKEKKTMKEEKETTNEITSIDIPVKKEDKDKTEKELPAPIKTPKEIYEPLFELVNKMSMSQDPEEKEKLRQILYETSKSVAEELKAYDLSMGLNDVQRELDPKVYEQIRMNTAKELDMAIEKGDLAKADLIDLTPEQKEAALNCKNLDKAYNVPVGMMKEWYDRNNREYPDNLKKIIDDIQNGRVKPPQEAAKEATKGAPVIRSAYAEFKKVEQEINALKENEKNPEAVSEIEVTLFHENGRVMDVYETWEKEQTNTQDLSHDEKEQDGPSIDD